MSGYVAEDAVAIRAVLAKREEERKAMLTYWCSCGHTGRMDYKQLDGHPVGSSCAKPCNE